MIDIENYVLTAIESAVTEQYPDAEVIGDSAEQFARFPAVTVNEIGNATIRRMQDDELTEHLARITYEINVYCNDRVARKTQCKNVLKIVDETMLGMKFTRTMIRRLPNIDRTIYRMYARYTAVVDEGTEDGNGNVTYQIYRP